MSYICNQSRTIVVKYEPGLLSWLQKKYPFSGYHLIEVQNETVS
jgi:hypothetical protein